MKAIEWKAKSAKWDSSLVQQIDENEIENAEEENKNIKIDGIKGSNAEEKLRTDDETEKKKN